jgi:hypothetical protein
LSFFCLITFYNFLFFPLKVERRRKRVSPPASLLRKVGFSDLGRVGECLQVLRGRERGREGISPLTSSFSAPYSPFTLLQIANKK